MIDIIFGILMIRAILKGYQKGLIIALFSVVGFIVGIAAAVKLSAAVANYLQAHISMSAKWLPMLSFSIVLIAVTWLVKLGARLIEKTFQMAMLGWANKIAGIVLFMILYTTIFSILLFYTEKMHLLSANMLQESKVYPFTQPWTPTIIEQFGKVIPIFKGMFAELESFFSDVSTKIPH